MDAHTSSISPVRVAVVDIGTNSTRLLIADVDQQSGELQELSRRSRVTRLGDGVDSNGSLSEAAVERVFATLAEYRAEIDARESEANLAVLTSAVRDAANGGEFAARVREDYGLDARVLSGDEEAQLTFLGAMSALYGGGLVAWLYGGVDPEAFLLRLRDAISIDHFTVGIIKAPVMAAVIGIVACVEGLAVEGSAESLGQHTTSSVVKGIFLVIVMDGVFAIFFASIGM